MLVLLYTTHLLDFEWQDYDNSLLAELQLPEFYFENAISKTHTHTHTHTHACMHTHTHTHTHTHICKHIECSGTEESVEIEKFEGEDEMMKHYLIHMELLKEFKEMRQWKDLFDLDIGRENKKVRGLEFLLPLHTHTHTRTHTLSISRSLIYMMYTYGHMYTHNRSHRMLICFLFVWPTSFLTKCPSSVMAVAAPSRDSGTVTLIVRKTLTFALSALNVSNSCSKYHQILILYS